MPNQLSSAPIELIAETSGLCGSAAFGLTQTRKVPMVNALPFRPASGKSSRAPKNGPDSWDQLCPQTPGLRQKDNVDDANDNVGDDNDDENHDENHDENDSGNE